MKFYFEMELKGINKQENLGEATTNKNFDGGTISCDVDCTLEELKELDRSIEKILQMVIDAGKPVIICIK